MRARPSVLRRFPLLVLALAASGCMTLENRTWNLRELHQPDGRPARAGRVLNRFEWLMANFGSFSIGSGERGPAGTPVEALEDSTGTCLDMLVGLERMNAENPEVRAYQAEFFTWLAVDDSVALSRERCVLGMIEAGGLYGAEGPQRLSPEVAALEARAVAALLKDLLAASAPLVRGEESAADLIALEAAIAAITSAPLDRQGARRLLAAVNSLRQRMGFTAARARPLTRLGDALARLSIELTLDEALRDPVARVRAAALEASVALSDYSLPELVERALLEGEGEAAVTAARLITARGLPQPPPGLSPDEVLGWRNGWLRRLVEFTVGTTDGTAATAGCQALAAVSGAPFTSLRPEAWGGWWRAQMGETP